MTQPVRSNQQTTMNEIDSLAIQPIAEELFQVNLTQTQIERFWRKVEKKSDDECWDWIGALNGQGYGNWWIPGKWLRATRVSYFLSKGSFLKRLSICHRCDRPSCCNPNHLFPGTQVENMQDSANKGRNGSQRYPEKRPKGTLVNTAKLTEEQVWEIRDRYANGERISKLSREYGIDWTATKLAATYKTWKSITR